MRPQGLAETLKDLNNKGYTIDFNLRKDLTKKNENFCTTDDEFIIDEVFRFDVMTDPDDQSVLYALSSPKTGKKGVLVNGYGIYTESSTNKKIQDLHRDPELHT